MTVSRANGTTVVARAERKSGFIEHTHSLLLYFRHSRPLTPIVAWKRTSFSGILRVHATLRVSLAKMRRDTVRPRMIEPKTAIALLPDAQETCCVS